MWISVCCCASGPTFCTCHPHRAFGVSSERSCPTQCCVGCHFNFLLENNLMVIAAVFSIVVVNASTERVLMIV